MRLAIVVGVACLGILTATGCGPSGRSPSAANARDEFQSVVERLEAEAKSKSVNGTTITLAPTVNAPDGRRIVAARRVRSDSTTVYTLEFANTSEGWACREAVAVETEPGSAPTTHRLAAQSIELDQLIIWLGW